MRVGIIGVTEEDLKKSRDTLGVFLPGEMGINLNACAKVTTQEEADALMEMFTAAIVRFADKTPQEADAILRKSIGYHCAELEDEIALRVFDLFRTEHPIVGRDRNLTWEQKLFAGMRFQADRVGDMNYETISPAMRALMLHHTKELARWRKVS